MSAKISLMDFVHICETFTRRLVTYDNPDLHMTENRPESLLVC